MARKPATEVPQTGATPVRVPPMFDWQRSVIQCQTRNIVVNAARQIGKTHLGVLLALNDAMQGGDVWWIAPDYSLTEPGYDLLQRLVDQPPFNTVVDSQGHRMVEEYKQRKLFTVRNGGRIGTIQIKSADDPQKLRGKTLTRAILDEFAFMHPDAWYDGVSHALTVKKGRALFISTPFGKNHFWDLYRLGDPDSLDYNPEWQSFTFDQSANPLISASEIEEKRKTLPLRKFEREVLAKWVDIGGEVFVNVRPQAVVIPNLPPLGVYNPEHHYVAGLDMSAGRQDYSVIIITDVTEMAQVAMYRFSTPSLPEHIRILKEVNDYWHPSVFEVEENSQAMFAVPEFKAIGLPIRAWNANWKSKPELIEHYAAAIELGRLRLLNDPVLVKEHEAMEANVTPSGVVQYNSPKGGNDDTVTAGALSYRAATVSEAAEVRQPLRFLPYSGLYGRDRTRERRKYR